MAALEAQEEETMVGKLRFYNGGNKISEALSFSLPDGHDIHCIARYLVEMPAQGFFEVPSEMELGAATIRVEFARDLMNRFGDRGVILVDKNREESSIGEREPVASSDRAAVEKGRERYTDFLRGIVQRHVDQCDQIRAAGGAPLAARGFTKHAFDVLGLEDPASLAMRVQNVQTTAPAADIQALQAQIDLLSKQLAQRNGGEGQPGLGLKNDQGKTK